MNFSNLKLKQFFTSFCIFFTVVVFAQTELQQKSIDPEEVANLVIEMKRYWKHIQKDLKTSTKKKTPAKKKVASKSKKKTTKKTS